MSAIYSIYTSPNHPPVPGHLPTLIVTPHGRSSHVLYTYLHTNNNKENYLLTPSDAGDLCVAKLYPTQSTTGTASAQSVRCEASRNLRWTINNTGIQNPVYKLTLPNPDQPSQDQPLFQVSKPSPHATWWTLFYFTYAGHLIPPKRIEFGKIQKNSPEAGGGTRVSITGKSDDEKAVWKTLGDANEDMVEWIVICAALVVLDNEIVTAATLAGINTGALPPNFPTRPEPAPSMPGHAPRTRTTSAPSSRDAQRALSPQAPPPMPSSVSASGHGQPSNHSGRHGQPLLEANPNSRARPPMPHPGHSHNNLLPNSSAYRAPPPEPLPPPPQPQPQPQPPSQSRHPYAGRAPLPSHAQYQSSHQPQMMPPVAHDTAPSRSSYEAGRPVQAPPPTHRTSSDPRYAQSAAQQPPSQYQQQQQPYPGSQPSMQLQPPTGGGVPSQPYRAGPPPPHHGSPNGRGESPQQSQRMPPPPQQHRQPMPPLQQRQHERPLIRHQLSDRPVGSDSLYDQGGRHRPHSAEPPRSQPSQLSASRSYPELPTPHQHSSMAHPPQHQQHQQREREQSGRGREPVGLAPSGHQSSPPRSRSQPRAQLQYHQQPQQPLPPQARPQYPLPQQGQPYPSQQSRPPQQQQQQQQQRPAGPPRPPQQQAPPQPQRQPLEPWLAPKGSAQNPIPTPVVAPTKPAAAASPEKKAPEKKNKSFALFSPPLASTKN